MIKITLDTNCIINILDYKSNSATSVEEISQIINYGLNSDVNIAITTRVESDIESDKDNDRKSEMLKRISMFPVIGTIFRLDNSKLDSGDFFIDTKTAELEDKLVKTIFPGLNKDDKHYKNKVNDIDHLVGHLINKRDLFVTEDKDILKKSETLKNSFDLKVMNPQQCIEYIELKANKLLLIEEFIKRLTTYRDLLISFSNGKNVSANSYNEERIWLMKKYPKIKDGLLNFKLNMLSVPAGPGQGMYDKGDLLGLSHLNQRIQYLFFDSTLSSQIKTITSNNHSFGGDAVKIKDEFQDIIDLLISYSGFLEEIF